MLSQPNKTTARANTKTKQPSPAPSWGGMIAEGREALGDYPHISFLGAGAMFLTVLSFNLVGDTLRSRLADLREAAV